MSSIRFHRPKKGMTLVEVMMVVIVIVILSSIVLPNYANMVDRARVTPQLSLILTAIKKLHGTTGQWPHGDASRNVYTLADWKSGAAGLLMNDPASPYPFWNGPYIEANDSIFIDYWGNPIWWDGCPDTEGGPGESSIASGGPDGVITSWNRADRTPQGDDII